MQISTPPYVSPSAQPRADVSADPEAADTSDGVSIGFDVTDPSGRAHVYTLLADAFCVIFGATMTLIVHGYQFGRGNHHVYLLDGLRRANPELFATDWFVNQTLQYHSIFGWLSAILYRTGLIEKAFLAGYLLLAVMLSASWYGIVRQMGGSQLTFLVSVVMFYLAAAGEGLGMYQFLQDSSFLPSNVAAVVMLAGIYFWLARRFSWAGLAFGLAGLFHLNYAVVGVGLWGAMGFWEFVAHCRGSQLSRNPLRNTPFLFGTALAVGLSLINIAMALRVATSQSGQMPLADFVSIYVHLRHPHHYDPASWPLALWISFLWATPFILVLNPRHSRSEVQTRVWREITRFFVLLCGLLMVALLGAGLFYVSETLVQMSLYRFSVFVKLISCCAAAYFFCDSGLIPRRYVRGTLIVLPILIAAILAIMLHPAFGEPSKFILRYWAPLVVLLAALAAPAAYAMRGSGSARPFIHLMGSIWLLSLVIGMWNNGMGITVPPRVDPDFLDVCRWARDPHNTPIDSVFLVPPADESFRLNAERAVVVNFKCVPQLSGELPEWRRRLERVLDVPNLLDVPKPYAYTVDFMKERYAALPAEHLFKVAREMQADYVVVGRHFHDRYDDALVFSDPDRDYCVYDVGRESILATKEETGGRGSDTPAVAGATWDSD